jgi:methionine-rich copper-binding protein CopC
MRYLHPHPSAMILALAFLSAFPGISWCHAFPDHSEPKVGATISASPARVRIWFDSNLEPAFSTITVENAKKERVDEKDGQVNPTDPTLLEVSLPSLPAGTYHVIWSVAAMDGHRTQGDFTFTIK